MSIEHFIEDDSEGLIIIDNDGKRWVIENGNLVPYDGDLSDVGVDGTQPKWLHDLLTKYHGENPDEREKRIRHQRMQLARVRALRMLNKYHGENPGERDEQGRFAPLGAGDGGSSSEAVVVATKPPPLTRQTGANALGANERVSTRIPSPAAAKRQGITPHQQSNLEPNVGAFKDALNSSAVIRGETRYRFREGVDNILEKYGQTGQETGKFPYPRFIRFPQNATREEKVEALVNHFESNIIALYDAAKPEYRERSKEWYEGARVIANQLSEEYGVSPRVAAGVMASLSPQRDWDQNVEMARRVLEIYKNRDNPIAGQELTKTREQMDAYLVKLAEERDELEAEFPDPETRTQGVITKLNNRHADIAFINEKLAPQLDGVKSLSTIQGDNADETRQLQSMALRFYDEGNGSRNYPIMEPEGRSSGELQRNQPTPKQEREGEPGTPSKYGWGGFASIGNALSIVGNDSMENISEQLGDNHKVRNFYNNIISPDYGTDITIDTHAIAAATLMPLGGSHPIVAEGLGTSGPKNADTGVKAMYPLYYEAYKRAAETISNRPGNQTVLPREMQSITWEALRGLYDPEEKSSQTVIDNAMEVWRLHGRGKISLERAQRAIIRRGIKPPRWAQ